MYLAKKRIRLSMTKRLAILLMMLPALSAAAQGFRLTPYKSPSALYLNVDRLYSYNRYEKSRLELGLQWVTPSETAEHPRMFIGQWMVKGFVGYGFGDKALKYGGGVQLRLPGSNDLRFYLKGYNDLEAAASRKLESYRLFTPDYNTTFLASRYVGVKGGRFDVSIAPSRKWSMAAGVFFNREDYRFDHLGNLIYPASKTTALAPAMRHMGLSARVDWSAGLTLLLAAGRMTPLASRNDTRNYFRALAQYNAEPGEYGLHVFAQAGYTTSGTPYSQMFDLSGTARSLYFFRNTFITVRPYTFTANMFAHLCLNYTAPMPLWETRWSQPQPFLQVNAMWGWLHGQDENGLVALADPAFGQGNTMLLQSPYMGLMELATGFDGLLRWGLIDFGAGVAYQLCPTKAPYLNENPTDNFALALLATFILDKTPPRVPVTPTQPYMIIQNN